MLRVNIPGSAVPFKQKLCLNPKKKNGSTAVSIAVTTVGVLPFIIALWVKLNTNTQAIELAAQVSLLWHISATRLSKLTHLLARCRRKLVLVSGRALRWEAAQQNYFLKAQARILIFFFAFRIKHAFLAYPTI